MLIRPIEEKDNLIVASIIRECLIEYGGDHREDTAWADPYSIRHSRMIDASIRLSFFSIGRINIR